MTSFFLKKKGQKNLHRNVIDRHSLTFFSFQTSPDGNVTLSILNYVPTIRDAGKYMACRAENPELPDATLEDGWKLEIYCKFFTIHSNLEITNLDIVNFAI